MAVNVLGRVTMLLPPHVAQRMVPSRSQLVWQTSQRIRIPSWLGSPAKRSSSPHWGHVTDAIIGSGGQHSWPPDPMMASVTCPQCGEDERLAGEPSQDGIRIRCEVCQTSWLRDGTIRCATCGGNNMVTRPKTLTAIVRGNQLSVLGWHDVHLCASCDAGAIDRSTSSGGPVSWDYVAAVSYTHLRAHE